MFSSSILAIFIEISENNPCFHSFLIAKEISSPGMIIFSPISNPLILIKVFLSRYFVPLTVILDIVYSLGFE